MGKYGYFSEDGYEYIITRPDTPAPWANYASNGKYHAIISNTGGGISYYISPRAHRITRWRYNSLPIDRPGRYIYIRDNSDGEYWSLTWQPVLKKLDSYQCRHGLGYTVISSTYRDIHGEVLYFVPLNDDLEIWRITLENKGKATKNISVFPFVELCLGDALADLIGHPNSQHFSRVNFDKEDNAIYATRLIGMSDDPVKNEGCWGKYVFFSSSLKAVGFDGIRDKFIGSPYRSESNPIVVEKGKCTNSELTSGDAVAVLQHDITLKPKEKIEFCVLMGVVDRVNYKANAKPILKKYKDLKNVDKEFLNLKSYYKNLLDHVWVETPDPDMNLMLNIWNKYQAKVCFIGSRDAGYYHGGLAYGVGFRDLAQDILGPLTYEPELAKEAIKELTMNQFSDGRTYHHFYRIVGGGWDAHFMDDPLWLPFAVIWYLKETADFAFLDEVTPYADKGKATIFEHYIAAINHILTNLTPRGLPKIIGGDWNDDLDNVGLKGKGESMMVAAFLCYILRETIGLLKFINRTEKVKEYQEAYDKVARAMNELCWDGEWYIRATKDNGEVIGSHKNKEGKLYLESNIWAVISGVAQGERAIKCMDSIKKYADTPKGPKLCTPAYTKVDYYIGGATKEAPGKKENASIFNHPVTWVIYAETVLGRGDMAYHYYKQSLPTSLCDDQDVYKTEPYVYSEYITGPDHPDFGQAGHSWLTGTAPWMYRVAIDFILGVQPEFDGLRVDPCIPTKWDSYKIRRKFRGATYNITVKNPNHHSKGVAKVIIDGKEHKGNLLPVFKKGEVHEVEVILA
jgi:cellobiose phosphorylase